MGLIERAKIDARIITSNSNEFGRSCVFTAPTGETATVIGIVNQHHTAYNELQERINVKISTITVSESLFDEAYYPVRNDEGEVSFRDHRVVADGQDYVCREWFADDTVGLIVITLGEFE